MRKALIILLAAASAIFAVGYLAASAFLYQQLADIRGGCERYAANRPDRFADPNGDLPGFDFSQYHMPSYQEVRFASRDTAIEISGWYVEADPGAPAVIVVHGLGSCKRSYTVLIPAGMLWHAGFNVLLIDVRDAGDSTFEDGRSAIGNEEYRDVLGAWDWLILEKRIPAERIGLLGYSLGAATTLIAFDQEPGVAAVFVDSPFDNLPQIIREELERNNYPVLLTPGGLLAARLLSGDDLLAHDPAGAITAAGDRPIYIVHGSADGRIGVHHSLQLQQRAVAIGAPATFWIVDGVDHVGAITTYPDEYETRLVSFFRQALMP